MARHFKSNSWAPRVSGSSGAVHLGRTDEASPRTSLVPVPVLMVGFKSTGIALTGLKNPLRPPEVVEQAASPPAEESTETTAEESSQSEAEAMPEAQLAATAGEANGPDTKFGSRWRLALRDRPATSEAE